MLKKGLWGTTIYNWWKLYHTLALLQGGTNNYTLKVNYFSFRHEHGCIHHSNLVVRRSATISNEEGGGVAGGLPTGFQLFDKEKREGCDVAKCVAWGNLQFHLISEGVEDVSH